MESETKNTILIIGGGLIGLSIAYEFARNKFNVEVLHIHKILFQVI